VLRGDKISDVIVFIICLIEDFDFELMVWMFELVFDNSCLWVVFGNFGFLECFD